jgi:hypothetical protein
MSRDTGRRDFAPLCQMAHGGGGLIGQRCVTYGIIQIIRDTLGEGGVRQNVTKTFFDFLNAALNAFGGN